MASLERISKILTLHTCSLKGSQRTVSTVKRWPVELAQGQLPDTVGAIFVPGKLFFCGALWWEQRVQLTDMFIPQHPCSLTAEEASRA